MSLLLDALKKAADDKKKSVDDSTDESVVQDNSRTNDEDSLELELDEKQIIDIEQDIDNDFPRVDDQPIVSQAQQAATPIDNHTMAEAVSDNADEPQADAAEDSHAQATDRQADLDEAHTEQSAEPQLTTTQSTDAEITDSSGQAGTESPPDDTLSATMAPESATTSAATAAAAVTQVADQHSAAEAVHTLKNSVNQADLTRQSTDNQAALSALINKSNQYQKRAQKKRTILLATLILLLISGSALFFFLKTEIASQQLYITQSSSSQLLREPPSSNRTPPTADEQATVTAGGNSQPQTAAPAHTHNGTSHSHSNEPADSQPRTTQTARPVRSAVANTTIDKPAATKVHIQQSSREDPIEPLIMGAYNAFQRGQYEQAEALYQKVQAQEPRNRDALLGLAAIALKQQRYEYARQKYQALLQLNPKDSLAIAGLGSLQHLPDATLSESQLKFMLKEQPDAAHLYFALGSLFAGKNQWPQAQSAYFSAWSADSNNADYAFNLAVSLDHINQPQQALQYYQLCLKLMRNSSANFSATQVQQRINSLQEAMR